MSSVHGRVGAIRAISVSYRLPPMVVIGHEATISPEFL